MGERPTFEKAVAALGSDGTAELDLAFENAPVGIYIDDPTLGCTYANAALLDLFGIDWSAFQGFGWARFVVSEDAERVQIEIQRFEHTRKPIDVTYRVRHEDGNLRWVNARIQAVSNDRNERVGSIGIVLDVTEEREQRKRAGAAQSLEAVGQLSARLAHDLNNLLTVIIGGSEAMSFEITSAAGRAHFEMVEVAFEQARQLTSQLLTLARGHVTSEATSALDAECQRLEQILRSTLGERITLEVELGATDAHIALDSSQVGQIIVNLATNARDAIPGSGTLRIETDCDEQWVTLRVIDDGEGMDSETLARAFDPFYTTKEVGRGSGLGLVTSKDIIELVAGEIQLDSTPGQGTRATIRLPRVSAIDYEPLRRQMGRTLGTEGLVTLLIEDNEALRQSIGYALALAGSTVRAAASLEEARSILHKNGPPDLVVTDVMLPDGLGTELLDLLRSERPNLPVIFMSGFASNAIDDLRRGYPNAEFLAKPFRSDELIRAIRGLVAQGTPQR